MEIFLVLLIIILATFFIVKKVLNSAKTNLFRDQAAWTGKDINIKYNKSNKISPSKSNNNYLKLIAEESSLYLQDQSIEEDK